ncbi:NrsF family protein [Celeribacter sp. ULVN23_4]
METDELIAALAADDIPPKRPHLALRVLAGAVLAFALMLATLGLRPDWAVAVQSLPVLAKQLVPLALAFVAGGLLFAKPSERVLPLWPFVAFGLIVALVWAAMALSGQDIMGQTAFACLVSIPLLALPLGAALFAGLRHRVEPFPARHGLIAGLFAGAVATTIYALHCDEDSPAFFLLWYSLGILICGAVGRYAGQRFLGV